MDELLHHCLRELSFDGDLGSSVSRLRDFIVGFYAHSGGSQNVDDAFCAFVWSLIVQQPTVRVGTVPPGVTSEVWIAPQSSAKRKAKAKGEEPSETVPVHLDILPTAQDRTLDDLRREYGDHLRVAVDPDAIYAAITGSHIRFAKLSPMVYSALQVITRGRDSGVTVVQLGQRSGYDQKTCFYLVKQLTDLDLVVKVRRGGVGTHFVIHRHFFDRSPSWKAIRDEESQAESSHNTVQTATTELSDEEEGATKLPALDFSPIDARHLSSLPLVRGRVVKLLKASRNSMYICNNMLRRIGFSNPTKTDRRFFQSRIRELIQQGIIEKVIVPSNNKKSVNTSVKCFRLVSKDHKGDEGEGVVVQSQDGDEDDRDAAGEQLGVKINVTVHKQIVDLLEESGTVGMTLNELSSALSHLDKRTIELLLARAEKYPPSSHLADLGIAGLMETSGRERRHRYLTLAAYRQLLAKENLDSGSSAYTEVDFSNVGGFLPVENDLFYEDQIALLRYQDAQESVEKSGGKKRPPKNPVLADGSVKRGRPRKYPVGEDPKSRQKVSKKRKLEASSAQAKLPGNDGESRPAKRQRLETNDIPEVDIIPEVSTTTPKKRGRPRRKEQEEVQIERDPPSVKKRNIRSKAASGKLPETEVTPSSIRARTAGRKQGVQAAEKPSKMKEKARTKPSTADVQPLSIEEIPGDQTPSPRSKRARVAATPSEGLAIIQPSVASSTEHLGTTSESARLVEAVASVNDPTSASSAPIPSNEAVTPQNLPTSTQFQNQSTFVPSSTQPPYVEFTASSSSIPPGSDSARLLPVIDTHTIPIDPALMVDVVEMTNRILFNSSTRTSSTPLSEQNIASYASTQSQDLQDLSRENLKTGTTEQTSKGPKVNVSHMRRENELCRVVQNMGGIVNIQTKEFFEGHMALLETMARSGEATSAPPGTRTDKRTVVSTFDKLERQGRIKQLKTSVMTHTGVPRVTCIVYLPTVPQETLNAFLADLSRDTQSAQSSSRAQNILKIDERVEYGTDPALVPRSALPLQLLQMNQSGDNRQERWSKNISRAEQLFSYDDSVIRDVLLTERTTLAQLYGFIVGKAVRLREFHLSTLDAFERKDRSPNIISHEKRIVDVSFFCHDIPLGLYCALISCLTHDDQLGQFIGTLEGRRTLVRDMPPHLHSMLQIGRSRARTRFLDLLETLHALKVVTPLQPSNSSQPWIICMASSGEPNAFDLASSEGWTINTPMAAPSYWHFHEMAPIHAWVVSEVSPPFLQDVSIATKANATNFWDLLDDACRNPEINTSERVSVTGPPTTVASIVRSLRRRVSWNSSYIMTWHQMQYLKQFMDVSNGNTPLQEEGEGALQIEKFSWVISAPQDSIREFFQTNRAKILRDLNKLRKDKEKRTPGNRAKRTAATKASLAKKAADARLQREVAWEEMLHRLHPTFLDPTLDIRLRHIRNRFLQASSAKAIDKWEAEISEAIREAQAVATKVLKGSNQRIFASRTAPVPMEIPPLTMAVNPPEKPVQTLIAMQGPPLVHEGGKRKGKGKLGQDEMGETKAKTLRRHRFQWNRDYDELARDASAIIRARCRNLSRLDWAAFEQVFPSVPRNTVRQRLAHLRDTPGNEAYLNRLEDKWYEIWLQQRGTPSLPDDDPTSSSNFDLIKHVEFLRRHVDKNALRVGFAQPAEKAEITLPPTIDKLLQEYDVVESASTAPPWDFVWNAVVEEGREKRMLRQPFLKMPQSMPQTGEPPPERVSLAESALKMTLGTPHGRYDPELASALLRSVGEQHVSVATQNLLGRGVLSKLVRDPQKQKPGRQLKISEVNQNAIGGSITRDTYQDAAALEDVSLQDNTWREWPLLATDGDSAALIQLVSDNNLEFKVDTSHAQSCRPDLDWNSKKADDDQIETVVHIRTKATLQSRPSAQSPESSPTPAIANLVAGVDPAHGQSVDGSSATCKRVNDVTVGLVDCKMCLEEEWAYFYDTLTTGEKQLAKHVLTAVRQGAEYGVTKSDLRLSTDVATTNGQLSSTVNRMVEWPIPLLFWAGFSSLVIVSSAYAKYWTVLVSENPVTRVFPRRWIDISGVKITDFWDAALKAVMGVVVFRPGISQAELRWRLRTIYDRQEAGDIMRFLLEAGHLKLRCDPALDLDDNLNVAVLDDREEMGVYWFIGDEKHWYQV